MNTIVLATQSKRYGVAVGATVLCFLIAYFLAPGIAKANPLILFLPAVMIATWYAGFIPGVIANFLSTLVIYYFFLPPYSSFMVKQFGSLLQLVLFLVEAAFVTFFIDSEHRQEKITAYKIREQENLKKIASLETDLKNAQQEITSRDEFLSISSHELKTPLTSVLMQVQTALHNIRSVSLAEFSVEHLLKMLQSTESQTQRLSRMINDLLNISLITTGRMELEIGDVDLTTLLHDVVEEFTPRLEREGYKVTLFAPDPILGRWDRLRIQQAIGNIISNAIKYGDKKPIVITLTKTNTEAILSVKDQGIGIAPSDQKKIFLLFQRASPNSDIKGLGVGLYLTHQIVSLHGGKIQIESKMNKGATFTIHLPLNTPELAP